MYSSYASTMKDIVQKPIDIHGYADDHSLKRSFVGSSRKEENATIDSLTESVDGRESFEDEQQQN